MTRGSKSSSTHTQLLDTCETFMNSCVFFSLLSGPKCEAQEVLAPANWWFKDSNSTHLLSLAISHDYLLLDTGEDRRHGKPELSLTALTSIRCLSKHLSLSFFVVFFNTALPLKRGCLDVAAISWH